MHKKRILIFGGDGYDNVSLNMERAFKQLGHVVEQFYFRKKNLNRYEFFFKFFVRSPFQIKALKLHEKMKEYLGNNYLDKVKQFKPDLVFIVHFGNIISDQIREITQKYGIPVAWWVMGDESLVSRYGSFNLNTYSYCTHLFIADTSWFSTFKLIGGAKLIYLPFAADNFLYKPLALANKFNLGLVAAFGPEVPTVIHKGFILSQLCREGFKIRAVTQGIKKYFSMMPELKKLDVVDEIYYPPQVNELYNQTKIILSLNNPQAKSDPSVRVMEIAASRNFQISEYRENTKALMGDSVIEFKTLDELVELAKFYLKNDTERDRLAQKSYELVSKEHTTLNRAQTVLKEVFLN